MVRGYRKTARKQTRSPVVVIRNAPPLVPGLTPDPPSADYPVRLTFLLPDTVLVCPGPHGFNTAVLPGNVVRIRGREARHCFALAREFFAVVAWDRAFTCRANITLDRVASAAATALQCPGRQPPFSRLFMVFKLDAADPTTLNGLGGDATMSAQKMDSRTNPIQASETPCAMTVAQIDRALRDFVLQDTAHLRRDAETASQDTSLREPEAPQMVSELVRQMAGASLTKLDEAIVDLSQLRDFQHAEGERIKREISGYLQLNQVAMGSTKLVVNNIAQCRAAAAAIAPRLGKGPIGASNPLRCGAMPC